uniref:Uncharacterized protein n=1 Tax=Sphaerodactylus townsendi TaxID=933632 RepID=A0ACB8EUY1_9SAUR
MDADAAGQGTDKVRFSKSLSKGEKVSTAFRKEKIKEALDALGIPYDWGTVPNIAVMGSGGGLRATIALCGTLVELKNQNILDCIMYLTGVSGSTWCMSSICKTENWTERLKELEKHQRETLTESQWNFETAANALMKATNDENYSLTDFWSYFIVYQLLNEFDESTLPEQRRSSENGKNPYPIYAALNIKSYEENLPGTWFEFTPHEVGIPDLGAYIDTKYFGSVFENGQMIEEKEEKNISYLQDYLRSFQVRMAAYSGGEEVDNLSSERTLSLIDPGMDINIAYPLILRPERNVKLILSFDFSSGNPFETVEKAADHCAKHGIRFPKIDGIKPEDKKNPSGCYIFRGRDAPTVMHFPLFNKENCLDKIEEYRIQFVTLKMKYTNGEIEKLLAAAKKNVVNAQQKIWEEIGRAVAPSP